MNGASTRSIPGGAYWLPVLLAASFPLVVVRWGGAQRNTAQPALSAAPRNQLALPDAFSPEIQYWTTHIQRWAVEYRLPVELIATVMQIESCGHPSVESAAGALGLFQVMPYHFEANDSPLIPEVNAQRGLNYLARALELARGDRRLALAGYNGGHGVIGHPTASWPAETRRYVEWGAQILQDVQRGLPVSPALDAWMQAGGASLCRRAATYLELG